MTHSALTRRRIGAAAKRSWASGNRPSVRGWTLSEETRARQSVAQKGRIVSAQTKEKLADSVSRRAKRWSGTWMEISLGRLLHRAGLVFEEQVRFGHYVVDAWVPSHGLVFEADASFWHQDKEREQLRDRFLEERGVVAVVHLDEYDLRPLKYHD